MALGAADKVHAGSRPLDASRFREGDVIAGKYRFERVVGSGGMGIVVEARHLQLGQSVAIKMLAVDESRRSEATARFLREGRAAAALRSDHVVRIYDVGTLDDGSPFIVMEFLRGVDLATLLENVGALPVEQAVDFAVQAADAIAEAHASGVIHRDLKPSNLFVIERNDGSACIKVLDFGISKSVGGDGPLDGNLTATRSVMGSPYYMSPEQVRDAKKVDARTDIWSLAVLLQELMTGEPVFHADTLPGICAAIAADPPAPLRAARPDVPPELEAVVMHCLEKDPARRYQTMRELMAALGPFRRRSSTRPLVPSLAEMAATSARQRSELSGAPTLAAAETESARIRGAIGAGARAAAAASDRTVLSAESHSTGRSKPPPKQRRIVLFAGTGLVIALSAALLARLASSPDSAALSAASQSAISPPTAAPARSSTFSLLIESTPSGAEVFEAGRLLGKTPLHLVVDKHAAQKDARTLTLRHPGYQSYSVVQGSSEENVRLVAVLVPEPALSEVVPPPSRSRASKPTRIRQTPERTAAPAPVDTDIRMQR